MAYRQQTTQVQDEMELETMAEAELARLKRQYRIMENDRIAYAEEARLQLRNQQKMIDRLEFEKAELALAIKASKSDSNTKKDQAMEAQLKCLLEKRTKYLEMIANERQQIAELQEQIIKVKLIIFATKIIENSCLPQGTCLILIRAPAYHFVQYIKNFTYR